ncbi:hypothetical protein CVT25_001346 [Psilocybe cyanescens]|uniref:Oxidoreductase AflY n=1 Tax=Psilocybe cyanescens TaxID=93625 RepID=A0A409XEQ9_PSICY|nr:hypothetical protein CVT25_001346 [Psilocybe cyanescens]
MSHLSYKLSKKGQLNLPGITFASKRTVEDLLLKDAEVHHCFFNSAGFHNHLSHHLLAAYDLGASSGHLKKMYDDEAKYQRPIISQDKDKDIVVDDQNWVQYLGNSSAYSAFVKFFSNKVQVLGVTGTLEKYVFEDDANENGILMLNRVAQYGAEFGNDTLVVTGLAQAAVHRAGTVLTGKTSTPSQSVTLFELLREVYDSEALKPALPYDPNAFINARLQRVVENGGAEEIRRICARYHISDDITDIELAKKTEEVIWVSTLLTFGTGRKGRKPRLDFFLMHILNSSLFLRPFFAVLRKPEHKAELLRVYIGVLVLTMLSRGRPRIDPEYLMSFTDVPRPPLDKGVFRSPIKSALGSPGDDGDYDPWPALIEGVQYHPDAHVLKALRTLVYGAQHFGITPPGEVIGAFRSQSQDGTKEETHVGIGKVDGTIFVRAAGVLMDTLGWVGYGQEEGQWDRSALGWDAAWENDA